MFDIFCQVIFYSVLDNEHSHSSFKIWICPLNFCFLSCNGVCSTPSSFLRMHLINLFCLEYEQNFDLNFKQGLQDITSEEGYYVHELFCHNFKVVS